MINYDTSQIQNYISIVGCLRFQVYNQLFNMTIDLKYDQRTFEILILKTNNFIILSQIENCFNLSVIFQVRRESTNINFKLPFKLRMELKNNDETENYMHQHHMVIFLKNMVEYADSNKKLTPTNELVVQFLNERSVCIEHNLLVSFKLSIDVSSVFLQIKSVFDLLHIINDNSNFTLTFNIKYSKKQKVYNVLITNQNNESFNQIHFVAISGRKLVNDIKHSEIIIKRTTRMYVKTNLNQLFAIENCYQSLSERLQIIPFQSMIYIVDNSTSYWINIKNVIENENESSTLSISIYTNRNILLDDFDIYEQQTFQSFNKSIKEKMVEWDDIYLSKSKFIYIKFNNIHYTNYEKCTVLRINFNIKSMNLIVLKKDINITLCQINLTNTLFKNQFLHMIGYSIIVGIGVFLILMISTIVIHRMMTNNHFDK